MAANYAWPTRSWTVFQGYFRSAELIAVANNQLIDLRTATLTGSATILTPQITPAPTSGEYRIDPARILGDPNICLLQSGRRLSGWTAQWSGGAMNVLACDSATKRIDLEVTFALKVGQLVCLTGSSGLSAQIPPSLPCWVVSASAVTGTSPRRQSITIAATVGGPALDPGNGPATANFFFWSLYDGEGGETRIPAPGNLRPGEFAYVPWDAGGRTIYFRPWDDVPIESASFELCQRNPTRPVIKIQGGNCRVLGGTVYVKGRCVPRSYMGCGTPGCRRDGGAPSVLI